MAALTLVLPLLLVFHQRDGYSVFRRKRPPIPINDNFWTVNFGSSSRFRSDSVVAFNRDAWSRKP